MNLILQDGPPGPSLELAGNAGIPAVMGQPVSVELADTELSAPCLTYTRRAGWKLEKKYTHTTGGGDLLLIPEGFSFDLASIPRPFWSLVAPFELSIVAPLLHDFLYRHMGQVPVGCAIPVRTWTRKEADQLFLEAMVREHVPAWRRHSAYRAVRTFGHFAWRKR